MVLRDHRCHKHVLQTHDWNFKWNWLRSSHRAVLHWTITTADTILSHGAAGELLKDRWYLVDMETGEHASEQNI